MNRWCGGKGTRWRGGSVTRVVWTAVTVACAGCGGEAARPAPIVRDSAGVTIVENPALPTDAALPWTVAAEPAVDMGLLEGDEAYQFYEVRGIARLSDGRIVVANGGSQELRFYDSAGKHLMSTGRKGGGPGEFEDLGLVAVRPGDTVAAADWNLRRVSFFDREGRFVRSFALASAAGFPVPVGPFADGTWLVTTGFAFAPGEVEQVVRDTATYQRLGEDGSVRDTVGHFPSYEYYVKGDKQSATAVSLPFGRTTETAIAGDRFYAGHSERYEIGRYDAHGRLELLIRLRRDPVPVTSADVDRFKARRVAEAEDQGRPRIERMYAEMPFPATFPAFGGLLVDALGGLWVLDFAAPGDTTRRWTVFGPDGVVLGVVQTPPGLNVREIGRDYVLGTWRDADEVEHVRLYALRRR